MAKNCNTLSIRVSLRCNKYRCFVELPLFSKRWKELGLGDDELISLQNLLSNNPKIGKVIKNSNGSRKVRFAFKNKGKSGSIRVIYVDLEIAEVIYLLTAYDKKEKADLTKSEVKYLKQIVDVINKQISGD